MSKEVPVRIFYRGSIDLPLNRQSISKGCWHYMKIKPILQKTYFRTFLLLTTVLICSIIPFVYLLSVEFAKYTMLEVRSNSQNEVDNLASKTEMILGNLKAYGLSMYADQNIQNWFFDASKDPLIDHAALVALFVIANCETAIPAKFSVCCTPFGPFSGGRAT